MAAGDYRIGLEGVFYWGTAGSQAATEADSVRTCTLNLTTREADTTKRGKTWATSKVILLEGSLEFEIIDQESDTLIAAARAAYLGKSRLAFWATDAASGEGLDADFYITSFTRNEPLEDIITYSVTAKPTDELRDPTWS